MNRILSVNNLYKYFNKDKLVLNNISFHVNKGEFVSIIGPSGAGKSTILRCINCLTQPTKGEIILGNKVINQIKGREIRKVRREIGMVFQNYNLVYRLTVMQNVMHGRLGYISGIKGILGLYSEEDKKKAVALLDKVGLINYMYKRASELSGGQKQRVGIVRALMQEPSLLLCDEPIASLDPGNSKVIMDLIRDLVKERGITCIVNLHQVEIAKRYADRIIGIKNGEVVFDGVPSLLSNKIIEDIYDTSMDNLMIGKREEKLNA
ncbi:MULTISPECIES: phosphonate ABC transporter ATP-binding protein [Clostridium]|uniref:Phosphonate ABC transporter ATP-binding protein n=1 Tax=Clostridium lapidicellarium TaxID=3240931 RepID=A0ABV4DU90_9CLOT|nr:phosphonate ABC transporter ATP-binding protein [uncultured Clostridium sp.]NLU07842.1 phosphonate ABC transporter ATP-binding protein [Clostridiales bacterium]